MHKKEYQPVESCQDNKDGSNYISSNSVASTINPARGKESNAPTYPKEDGEGNGDSELLLDVDVTRELSGRRLASLQQ